MDGLSPEYVAVKILSRLFRRLMLEMLLAAHDAGRLQFFGNHTHLAGKAAFKAHLAPLHRTKWFVYSKRPFAGPEQVLACLSHYTHRVAISNSRLIAADATGVTFSYKDYRIVGPGRYKNRAVYVCPSAMTDSGSCHTDPVVAAPATATAILLDDCPAAYRAARDGGDATSTASRSSAACWMKTSRPRSISRQPARKHWPSLSGSARVMKLATAPERLHWTRRLPADSLRGV